MGQKAELHLHLQRRLPRVRVDPNQLEMALLNIVVNARDASPKGGAITVTTKALRLDDEAARYRLEPGEYVALSVRDEGTGMPAHIRVRATEPFFTTKEVGQGTGLGLAMAHGFAQQSRGSLDVESEFGRGSTICMLFPVTAPEDAGGDAATKPTGYQARPVDDLTPAPRILVVDDSAEIADMAREALSDLGYRVAVADGGEDALSLVEEARESGDPFALVFSDILMPGGINGLVVAERLRESSPEMPVILTTGYNDEMVLDGLRSGGFEVLCKPWRRSELINRVQAALRRGTRTGTGRMTSDFGHAKE